MENALRGNGKALETLDLDAVDQDVADSRHDKSCFGNWRNSCKTAWRLGRLRIDPGPCATASRK